MKLSLATRTRKHVQIFWEQTQDPQIQKMFPSSVNSLSQAIKLFEESQQDKAKSFGQIILADNIYIGDIWCYSIDEEDEHHAMLSIVIFDKTYWKRGVASSVIPLFIEDIFSRYKIDAIGAFTFASNLASRRSLQKSGFIELESFIEDGQESIYLEYKKEE